MWCAEGSDEHVSRCKAGTVDTVAGEYICLGIIVVVLSIIMHIYRHIHRHICECTYVYMCV